MPVSSYDAVVVGGGHNGLVAAAYLAKQGLRTVVLEKRDIVGGAAVSEHPFGPDYTVTSLSYVVSLLPPTLVRDLNLDRHGYHVYPQGPYFAPHSDGTYLQLPSDHARRREQIAKFSDKDAEAIDRWDAWLDRLGRGHGPDAHRDPAEGRVAQAGRPRPTGLPAAQAARRRHPDGRRPDPAADDERRRPDRGLLRVRRAAGRARRVRRHRHLGGAAQRRDGVRHGAPPHRRHRRRPDRCLGVPARRHGWREQRARLGRPVLRGGDPHRRLRSRASPSPTAVRPASSWSPARRSRAADRHHDGAPADLLPAAARPARPAGRLRRGHRALEDAQRHREDQRRRRPAAGVRLQAGLRPRGARRHDRARRQPRRDRDLLPGSGGREARTRPFADICIPSVFDDSLAPEGQHIVSMFTQWVPHTWNLEPHRPSSRPTPTAWWRAWTRSRPGFSDSVLHRQVIGPHEMEHEYGLVGGNIFHGELSAGQMFHARPAAGYADLRTPIDGLYQAGSGTHGGGGVTGVPGRNVVRQVLADRKRAAWRDRFRATAGERAAGRAAPAPLRRAGGVPARARRGAAEQLDLRGKAGRARPRGVGHGRARAGSAGGRRPPR